MDADARLIRRQGRRWHFADAVFDEASWQLTVAGESKRLEAKPLELLHELLLNAGDVVSKEQLLDAIWPDVHVVEGSITTAIGKLRKALRDERVNQPIIETVPTIGYRITCEVDCRRREGDAGHASAPPAPAAETRRTWWTGTAALAGAAVLIAVSSSIPRQAEPAQVSAPQVSGPRVLAALRRLDQPAIDGMLRAGWKPDSPLDNQGNTALNRVLEICEWNPDHDRQALVQIARALVDAGATPGLRNYWGDTAFSIARAPRYCGPDHPVTAMLRSVCVNTHYAGDSLGDNCAADYKNSAAARNGGKLPS